MQAQAQSRAKFDDLPLRASELTGGVLAVRAARINMFYEVSISPQAECRRIVEHVSRVGSNPPSNFPNFKNNFHYI